MRFWHRVFSDLTSAKDPHLGCIGVVDDDGLVRGSGRRAYAAADLAPLLLGDVEHEQVVVNTRGLPIVELTAIQDQSENKEQTRKRTDRQIVSTYPSMVADSSCVALCQRRPLSSLTRSWSGAPASLRRISVWACRTQRW